MAQLSTVIPNDGRNRTLRWAAVALVIPLAMPIAGAWQGTAATPTPVPAILDVTGWDDQRVTLTLEEAMHLPVPAASTNIGPGSYLLLDRPDGLFICTANFVWEGTNGKDYLGSAGHCFLPVGKTATHGTGNDYNPSGTSVEVCISSCLFGGQMGAIIRGTFVDLGAVAYARQTENGVDVGHDFGIVEIPSSQSARIRPSMPVWGGPIGTTTVTLAKPLCWYGNAMGLGEVYLTKARVAVGTGGGAISFSMDGPSFQGDSGSGVEACAKDATGVHGTGAVGVLTHLTPGTGFVSGTTMAQAISMATEASLTISLMDGV